MAESVIAYVKNYGDYTFAEKPLNNVDSLVLCQLSYLKFDGLVPSLKQRLRAVSLRRVASDKAVCAIFADKRYEEPNRALFDAVRKSKRYRELKMNYYVNLIDTVQETQFSAITFFLEDNLIFIAYRGTDETLIGWKEDFNMAFQSPVPGQRYAVEYLKEVASRFSGNFYVGGHSKGGNFAVYAAMFCGEGIQDRILKIYSMDGPGFPGELLKKEEYAAIMDRLIKILPHSSLVGMLFETFAGSRVVESKRFGLFQHDPYTWLTEGDDFVYVKGIYGGRQFANDTLNAWIRSLDRDKRRFLIDTLYRIISASKAKDLPELAADWKKSTAGMLAEIREMDKESRRQFLVLIKRYFETAGKKLRFSDPVHKRDKEA